MLFAEIIIYIGVFMGLYFSVFMIFTFLEGRHEIHRKPKSGKYPKICLVVPCFNESATVKETLDSIIKTDYPKDKLEVIVIDDGSIDNTYDIAKEVSNNHPYISVYKKENGGKHSAMNFAMTKTDAKFIGSMDADSFVSPDSLRIMMNHFESDDIKAVVSTIKTRRTKNIAEKIQFIEFMIAAFLRKIFGVIDSISVVPGPLSIFRKEIFDNTGPYVKGHQTEDLELGMRLQRHNFRIVHAIDAKVYTNPCEDFKTMTNQRLRWRRGFLMNLKDYTDLLDFKSHGNLSFLLYFNILGALIAIFITGYFAYSFIKFLVLKIHSLLLLGIDFSTISFSLGLENFNFKPSLFLGVVSLGVFLFYFLYARRITGEEKYRIKEVTYYILLYAFLNAFWWIFSFYSAIFNKEINWSNVWKIKDSK